MDRCVNCGKYGNIEKHHIIKRSQSTPMKNCRLNLINLCQKCHLEIHNNKKLDIKYKSILYAKLKRIFNMPVYSINEIQDILNINDNEVKKLTKTIAIQNKVDSEKLLLSIFGSKLDIRITEIGE